eukprot:SAG31_NODE_5355_length_2591_cov_2.022472_5_plen_46_part_00
MAKRLSMANFSALLWPRAPVSALPHGYVMMMGFSMTPQLRHPCNP